MSKTREALIIYLDDSFNGNEEAARNRIRGRGRTEMAPGPSGLPRVPRRVPRPTTAWTELLQYPKSPGSPAKQRREERSERGMRRRGGDAGDGITAGVRKILERKGRKRQRPTGEHALATKARVLTRTAHSGSEPRLDEQNAAGDRGAAAGAITEVAAGATAAMVTRFAATQLTEAEATVSRGRRHGRRAVPTTTRPDRRRSEQTGFPASPYLEN